MLLRSALHRAGAAALTELLQLPAPADDQRQIPCACGHAARSQGLRSKPLLTVLGPVEVSRSYYGCSHCGAGQFPADVELDIKDKEFSPGVRRMQALVGQDVPFDHGRQQLELLTGLEVNAKSVERTSEAVGEDIARREQEEIGRAVQLDLPVILGESVPVLYVEMDGTGVPVVKKETLDRKGKKVGEPAHTREVKLGCVFTQTRWDEEGYAIRDPDTTTHVGAIETAEEFGKRLYVEAWKRGSSRAHKKVVLGDGAGWIWNLADQHFPGAIQIVDLFHARQHLWDLVRKLHPNDEKSQKRWIRVPFAPGTHGHVFEGLGLPQLGKPRASAFPSLPLPDSYRSQSPMPSPTPPLSSLLFQSASGGNPHFLACSSNAAQTSCSASPPDNCSASCARNAIKSRRKRVCAKASSCPLPDGHSLPEAESRELFAERSHRTVCRMSSHRSAAARSLATWMAFPSKDATSASRGDCLLSTSTSDPMVSIQPRLTWLSAHSPPSARHRSIA